MLSSSFFFTDGTVYYLTVSTDDVLNTTNNETAFTELTIFFKRKLGYESTKRISS